MKTGIEAWHEMLETRDYTALDRILDDDCVFHSPVVHTPQQGKAITEMYLQAAASVLLESDFRYVREVRGERDAVCEFTAVIDGISINGVDMISWNDEGRITDFKVMVRPLKAMNLLHRLMGALLEKSA